MTRVCVCLFFCLFVFVFVFVFVFFLFFFNYFFFWGGGGGGGGGISDISELLDYSKYCCLLDKGLNLSRNPLTHSIELLKLLGRINEQILKF